MSNYLNYNDDITHDTENNLEFNILKLEMNLFKIEINNLKNDIIHNNKQLFDIIKILIILLILIFL